MVSEALFTTLNKICTGQKLDDNHADFFIVNKFLACNKLTQPTAEKIDKYLFWLPEPLLRLLYEINLPKLKKAPFFFYIKEPKVEFTEEQLEMQKYFGYTNRELKMVLEVAN